MKIILILGLIFLTKISKAQQDFIHFELDETGNISFGEPAQKNSKKNSESETFLKTILKAKPSDELKLVRNVVDERGIKHLSFQQFYKGIKVEGRYFKVHGKESIEIVNGDFAVVDIKNTTPQIDQAIALNKILESLILRKIQKLK